MNNSENEKIKENFKIFQERLFIYKSFGYDFMAERELVLNKCLPLKGEILEIGTGKGHFSVALAKSGYKFKSVDISEEEQKFALLNLQYFGLENNVELRIENAEQLSYPDNYFDVIVSVNLIHHLQNPFVVIDEILRVIKPDGKIVISDFTPHGFGVIQKIHESEGRVHEINNILIKDIEKYFSQKGFPVKRTASEMQDILMIELDVKGYMVPNIFEFAQF